MYIVDAGNNRLSQYVLSSGAYIGSVGLLSSSTGTCAATGVATTYCTGGTFTTGAGDGEFGGMAAMTYNPATDSLFIGDAGNSRIVKYTASSGHFVGAIGNLSSSTGTCPATGAATTWCTGGLFSSTQIDGSYGNNIGMSSDLTNGFLFIADESDNRISKVTLDGRFVGAIGYVQTSTGTCPTGGAYADGWCTGGTFAGNPTQGSGGGGF